MASLWQETTKLPSFEPLKADQKTDVLIIGGGLAGLLCAYFLHQAGVDYILVEADRIGQGATGHTTAKVTAQHGLIYQELLRKFGPERAQMYYEANHAALERYAGLCKTIHCGFERRDAYVYSVDCADKLEQELSALDRLGIPADGIDRLPLPFATAGAVRFRNQAQFEPLKFAAGIAEGLNIYEHTAVREYTGGAVKTDHGSIAADQIIVTTHFPIFNKHGGYFLKLYQHRSYVLALENAPQVDGMYVDEAPKGMSFRDAGDLLLIGGGDHRTGKQGGGWAELRAFAERHYPKASETYHWAAQDCMSLDGVPYIGQYGTHTPGLYVATGFNKWGMTSSMAAAMILCDLVQGRENPYAAVFSPARTSLRPQLLVNGVEAAVNLLTPTRPRCPHMGCALKWNKAERTWDCPCHGSRFGEAGALLDGPATGDLKI